MRQALGFTQWMTQGTEGGGHLGMSTVIRFLFRIDGHGLVVKHEYVTSQTCGRENN